MPAEPMLLVCPLLAAFIGLPALAAARRRHASRVASGVADELAAFAVAVRGAERNLPMDDSLQARICSLRTAEASPLQLAQELDRAEPGVLADIAQRLASRLRRRVAFERKMLARTASGLRRGAVAASLPPLLVVGLQMAGADIPTATQLALLFIEAAGCLLLWRLAHVEI